MGQSNSTLEECPRDSNDFIDVETLMRNTIVSHANDIQLTDYEICKVYKINNPTLSKRVKRKRAALMQRAPRNTDERILFHGTPHAKKIAEEGFNVGTSSSFNNFGSGIYMTSLSSKANQYAWHRAGCPAHQRKDCYSCTRTMLICRCIMGKEFQTVTPRSSVPPGYNSIVAMPTSSNKSLKYPEFVLLDSDQVEPLYYVVYKILYIRNNIDGDEGICTIT